MNLSQIAKNIDKSDSNKVPVDIELFTKLLNIDLPSDHLPNEKITCYTFARWKCSDKEIGGKIYFLSNTVVAVSWQPTSFDKENINFVSRQAVRLLREYFLNLIPDNLIYANLGEEMGAGYQLLANYQLLDKQIIIDNELANVISNDGSGLRVLLSSGVVKNIHDEDFLVPYRINFISNEMYEKKVPYIAKFHGITNHCGRLVFPDSVTVKDKVIELFYDADHPNDRTFEEYTKESINDFFKPNIDVSISGEAYTKRWHDNGTEWLDSKEIFCKLNIAKEAKSYLEKGGIISEIVLLDGTVLHRIGLRDNYIG